MDVMRKSLVWIFASLAGALITAASPAAAVAAQISYVNKLNIAVNIESASIIRGRVVPDQSLPIGPGKMDKHANVPAGPRLIRVMDANMPGRLLFKTAFTVNNPGQVLRFSLEMVKPAQGGPARPVLVPIRP